MKPEFLPDISDCGEIHRSGVHTDGVFTISPDGRCPFNVYCDMTNGGWTIVQKRDSGSENFYRSWEDYVVGFGDISGEHWLGLDKIHRLTQSGYEIFFDMENFDGTKEFANYKSFIVHGASTFYRMNVDPFQYNGSIPELFSYHDNMKFSTFDRDNDSSSKNCVTEYLDGGGWWYKSCWSLGNLNGIYGKKEQGGISYYNTKVIPIKNVQIKVKARFEVC